MARTRIAASVALLLLVAAVAGVAAQTKSVAPATGKSGSKSSKGCSSIAGCRSCSKSGCTACKTGATLSGGRCSCPAGTGQYGTANTEPVVTGRRKLSQAQPAAAAASKPAASGTKPAHGGKGGKGGKGGGGGGGGGGSGASSFACAPCAADSYSATSKLVSQARCTQCPAGMQASEDRTTCLVPPGSYWNSATGQLVVCPAGSWCPGGDFQSATAGRAKNLCPTGSTSAQGSDELSDCTVPAGSFFDEDTGKVIKCPIGSWCPGGSVTGEGESVTACPTGATTSTVGASSFSQCTVPPGSYYDEASQTVRLCPVNTYCPGGSVDGDAASPVNCPTGTSFPAEGGDELDECEVDEGFYWDAQTQTVVQCPANKYCEGGPIGGSGSVIKNCPTGTTSPVQSDEISDCVVAPGYWFDGTNVVLCPAGSYCAGGPIDGAGAVKTACPTNSNSVAGSDAKADCTLNPGYYCLYTGTDCAVTLCDANQYCPGGESITNVNDNGSRGCPTGSVSVAGSDAVADCTIPAGKYCATYTNGVCSSIVPCLANKYCPGGTSVTNTNDPGIKNCPANTSSAVGSDAKADCELNPGYYCVYSAANVCTVTRCPANSYCPGGSSVEDPTSPGDVDCPAGTTSPVGSNAADDCVVAPGYYFDGTAVVICPANEWCAGGPISGAGSVNNACPTGSVSVAGSDAVADCTIPAGKYCATYTSGVCSSIVPCLANKYCPGGTSVTNTNDPGLKNCPANTSSAVGSDAKADCTLNPGYYCVYSAANVCTVTRCAAGAYCAGGASIEDPSDDGSVDCPAGTTSPVGSDAADDCVVAPGYYYDGTSVVICPANKYCAGGPLSGAGSVATDCPTGSVSVAGSDAIGDCKLPAGSYCVYAGTVCTITTCTAGNYCPGGDGLDDPTNTGLKPCPANTGSLAGSDAKADCTLNPGYFCSFDANNVCTVTACPANSFCPGGSSITDATQSGKTACPTHSTAPAGSDAVADCVLAPGYTCDFTGVVAGDACAIVLCSANDYCTGGNSITDQTPTIPSSLACPAHSTSPAGSDARADCVLDAGYYCVFLVANVCTATVCPTGSYCPGGNSVTDTVNIGLNQCPSGTTTTGTGATSSSQCITACGPNQVLLSGACVCNVGFFATSPLPDLYCTSCELATGIPGSSNTQPGETTQGSCSTCTYGYQYIAGTPGSCSPICNNYIANSNSTLPGPTTTADCDKCAIGYYIVDNDGSGTLTPGDSCAPCPNGGYGTGLIATCVSQCNYNEYYDTNTNTCLACPNGRVTDPDAPLGSPTNAGPGVCLCGPGSYISDGNYNNLAGTCVACSPALTEAGAVYRTVPKYGATSNADCQFACGPGYKQASATRCFKCQTVDTWSPGGLVDTSGPTVCYSCDTTAGYIAAYIDSNGDAICNASGVNGNQACVPCNACAAGTLPNSYGTCTPPP